MSINVILQIVLNWISLLSEFQNIKYVQNAQIWRCLCFIGISFSGNGAGKSDAAVPRRLQLFHSVRRVLPGRYGHYGRRQHQRRLARPGGIPPKKTKLIYFLSEDSHSPRHFGGDRDHFRCVSGYGVDDRLHHHPGLGRHQHPATAGARHQRQQGGQTRHSKFEHTPTLSIRSSPPSSPPTLSTPSFQVLLEQISSQSVQLVSPNNSFAPANNASPTVHEVETLSSSPLSYQPPPCAFNQSCPFGLMNYFQVLLYCSNLSILFLHNYASIGSDQKLLILSIFISKY